MEENKMDVPESEETVSAETEDTANAASEDAAEEKLGRGDKKKLRKAEAEIEELKRKLEAKEAEAAELNDRYMRILAEYDNYRKRTAKEKEAAYVDACCDAMAGILPVLDNLERAAQYNTGEETPMGKGLELTLKSFVEALSKMGIAEIEAEGKQFDPNVHNAVMHIEDENLGENLVVEVFMKGYAKGDKVLRHSMVKVAN